MKNLWMLLSVPLVFAACDMSDMTTQAAAVPAVPADDADFASFTGLRQETYYLRPDPSLDTSLVTMALTEETFFTPGSPYQNSWIPNAATVTFPLKTLFEAGSYPLQGSGTIMIRYRQATYPNNTSNYYFTSVAFNNTHTTALAFDTLNPAEEYQIDDPFTGNSLTLPLKGYQPDPYYLTFRGRSFTIRLSTDQFRALATPMGSYPNQLSNLGGYSNFYNDPAPAAPEITGPLAGSVYRQDPYRMASREFFRYKHFTITYPGSAPIFVVTPGAMVESYTFDPDANSLSVTLKDYNTPYSDPLLIFWIQAEDGTVRQKVISIGDQ